LYFRALDRYWLYFRRFRQFSSYWQETSRLNIYYTRNISINKLKRNNITKEHAKLLFWCHNKNFFTSFVLWSILLGIKNTRDIMICVMSDYTISFVFNFELWFVFENYSLTMKLLWVYLCNTKSYPQCLEILKT